MEEEETIQIDITDDQFLILAKAAHEKNITFNQYVNQVLKEYIDKLNAELATDE
jgi:predicted HicB family RNase H-like nuclease